MRNISTAEELANLGFSNDKNTFTTEIFDKLQFSGKRVKELMVEYAKLCVRQLKTLQKLKYLSGETEYLKQEDWDEILNNIK